jgi:hypothetical protein
VGRVPSQQNRVERMCWLPNKTGAFPISFPSNEAHDITFLSVCPSVLTLCGSTHCPAVCVSSVNCVTRLARLRTYCMELNTTRETTRC